MKKILLITILLSTILLGFLILPGKALAQCTGFIPYVCESWYPYYESCANCSDCSCSASCGNSVCESTLGESPNNCPSDCPPAPSRDVMVVLNNVINWIFIILLVIAVIFILMAAYYFVTASGNPEQVTRARNFVLYALVGVLVAFMARGLVALIKAIVG